MNRYTSILFTLIIVLSGCETNPNIKIASNTFRSVDKVSTDLIKGLSDEVDVEALLGKPSGKGEILLPPDHDRYQIWFYEDIELVSQDIFAQGETVVIEAGFRQQYMTIFFSKGKFQGFLWSSSEKDITGYGRLK